MKTKNKAKLIEILRKLEPSESGRIDDFQVKNIIDTFEQVDTESKETLEQLMNRVIQSMGKYHLSMQIALKGLTDAFNEHGEMVGKGLRSLDSSIKDGAPKDFSGFFKDIGTQLVQGNKHSKDTSDLIRNLKWNSSMQIRGRTTGAPIDPLVIAPSVAIGNGSVTTAGTAVQLSTTSVPCTRVIIFNNDTNSSLTNNGTIVVGDSTVVAASATRKGAVIYAANYIEFHVSDLNLLWIDSLDNGTKYHYYYEKFS